MISKTESAVVDVIRLMIPGQWEAVEDICALTSLSVWDLTPELIRASKRGELEADYLFSRFRRPIQLESSVKIKKRRSKPKVEKRPVRDRLFDALTDEWRFAQDLAEELGFKQARSLSIAIGVLAKEGNIDRSMRRSMPVYRRPPYTRSELSELQEIVVKESDSAEKTETQPVQVGDLPSPYLPDNRTITHRVAVGGTEVSISWTNKAAFLDDEEIGKGDMEELIRILLEVQLCLWGDAAEDDLEQARSG